MDNWAKIKQITNKLGKEFLNIIENQQQDNVQQQILRSIISQNKDTLFGQQYNFTNIKNYKDFCNNVPIKRYEDFTSYIAKISNGESNILTSQPVIQFEETSGSTTASKLIPYTQSTLLAFQKAIVPWLNNLLTIRPNITKGKVFFIISPAIRTAENYSNIPIGSGEDLLYFGDTLANLLNTVVITASDILASKNAEEWIYNTSLSLLSSDDLSFISIWSPTLLIELIDYIIGNKDKLLANIQCINRRKLLSNSISQSTIITENIWPKLDTISCWNSHTSKIYAYSLSKIFKNVFIQGKGLLSTEAITTIPYGDSSSLILAYNSHFYEFIDKIGAVKLHHQLELEQEYRLIVSTQSGLYRYDTGDKLIVSGFYQNHTPILTFIGRDSLTSDLCGEKITECFFSDILAKIDQELLGNAVLVAIKTPKPSYQLIIDEKFISDNRQNLLRERIENALNDNPQYAYARQIGQLRPITIQRVKSIIAYLKVMHPEQINNIATIKVPSLLV